MSPLHLIIDFLIVALLLALFVGAIVSVVRDNRAQRRYHAQAEEAWGEVAAWLADRMRERRERDRAQRERLLMESALRWAEHVSGVKHPPACKSCRIRRAICDGACRGPKPPPPPSPPPRKP